MIWVRRQKSGSLQGNYCFRKACQTLIYKGGARKTNKHCAKQLPVCQNNITSFLKHTLKPWFCPWGFLSPAFWEAVTWQPVMLWGSSFPRQLVSRPAGGLVCVPPPEQSRPAAVSHHHNELHHIMSHSGSTPPLHNPVRFGNIKGGGASLICLQQQL